MKTELIKLLDVLKDEKTHIVTEVSGHRVVRGDVIYYGGHWITVNEFYLERTRFHFSYFVTGVEWEIYGETRDQFFLKRVTLE